MKLEEVIETAIKEHSEIKAKYKCTPREYIADKVRKWMVEQGYHKTPLMTCYYCHQEIANKDMDTALSFKSKELVTMMHDVCKNCEAIHIEKIENEECKRIIHGYQPTVDDTDDNNPPTEDSDTK